MAGMRTGGAGDERQVASRTIQTPGGCSRHLKRVTSRRTKRPRRLEQFLARFSSVKTFEELQKPLAIATTDINMGMPVYYYGGAIGPALRASL